MTKEEIIEGNRLIIDSPFSSELHKKLLAKILKYEGTDERFWTIYKPHEKWDIIMPICKNVADNAFLTSLPNGVPSITPYINAIRRMKRAVIRFDIIETYLGLISFIQWYNQQKPQTK